MSDKKEKLSTDKPSSESFANNLISAFLQGLTKGQDDEKSNVEVKETDVKVKDPSAGGKEELLMPIILMPDIPSINKLFFIHVDVGQLSQSKATAHLKKFHLAFAALVSKLDSKTAFVFIPVRGIQTYVQVFDI